MNNKQTDKKDTRVKPDPTRDEPQEAVNKNFRGNTVNSSAKARQKRLATRGARRK